MQPNQTYGQASSMNVGEGVGYRWRARSRPGSKADVGGVRAFYRCLWRRRRWWRSRPWSPTTCIRRPVAVAGSSNPWEALRPPRLLPPPFPSGASHPAPAESPPSPSPIQSTRRHHPAHWNETSGSSVPNASQRGTGSRRVRPRASEEVSIAVSGTEKQGTN